MMGRYSRGSWENVSLRRSLRDSVRFHHYPQKISVVISAHMEGRRFDYQNTELISIWEKTKELKIPVSKDRKMSTSEVSLWRTSRLDLTELQSVLMGSLWSSPCGLLLLLAVLCSLRPQISELQAHSLPYRHLLIKLYIPAKNEICIYSPKSLSKISISMEE